MKKTLSKLLVLFMLFSIISSNMRIDVQAVIDTKINSSTNDYDEPVQNTSSDENNETFSEGDRLGIDNLGIDNLPAEYNIYRAFSSAESTISLANCTNIRPIVIYIKFSDDTTPYFTNDMLNEIKNGLSSSSGFSLSNYVNWISYGKCSIDPIFTYDKNKIIYTPAHPSSYYKKYKAGINEQGYKTDKEKRARRDELFGNAIKECTKNIDFSNVDLDRNGDGNIDSIFFFNSSYDDYAEILYSEKWAIWSEQPEIVDKSGKKKKVYDYINIAQNFGGWGRRVLTHEFSHNLGFPDMYPYGTVKKGLEEACGHYTMMCDNAGYPTVLERMEYGKWISEEDIDTIKYDGYYSLYDVTNNPSLNIAYKIEIPYSDEYFMVEYRNKNANAVEGLIPKSGILVYRVDPSASGKGNTDYEPEIYVMRNSSSQKADEGVLTGEEGRKSVKLVLKSGEDTGYSIEYVTTRGNYAQFKLVCNTGVRYSTIVQGNSSFEGYSCDGEISGTEGQGKRIDGLKMDTYAPNGSIKYRAFIRNVGWTNWVSSNEEIKANGNDIENIQVKLTGSVSNWYNVYYRTHNRYHGWLGWTSNGASAGTSNYGSAIEGIQVRVIKKGTTVSGITNDTNSAYKENSQKYTVTFKDYNGAVLKTESVSYGTSATAPSNPARTGYTFAGWNKSFDHIWQDTVVTAKYNINKYTVTFKNYDGTVLKTQTVSYGSSATAPSNPTRTGYMFAGWDKSFSNIKQNTVVTATYEKNQTTIYYKGYDNPYIHYKVGNGSWTNAPGVKMSSNSDVDGYNYAITIELGSASNLTVCFNDGNGSWDNNSKKNYSFGAGYYTFKNGVMTKIDKPTKKLSITSLTTNYSKGVTGLRPVTISTGVKNAQGTVKYTYTDTAADGTIKTIKANTTESSISWSPSSYGNHVIKVTATDGVTTVSKTIVFAVNSYAKVDISGPYTTSVGKATTFTMNATGGTGNITYKFYLATSSYSKNLLQSSNNNTLTWKPTKAGIYYIYYAISDEGGDVDHEIGYVQVTVEEKVESKTVIYYKGYDAPYIHYKVGNGSWTNAPGVKMSSNSEVNGYNYAITIDLGDADNITACFNNGSGSWDSNDGKNYSFGEGYYTFSNGVITKINKPEPQKLNIASVVGENVSIDEATNTITYYYDTEGKLKVNVAGGSGSYVYDLQLTYTRYGIVYIPVVSSTTSEISFKPQATGTQLPYTVRITVKDSKGEEVNKTYAIKYEQKKTKTLTIYYKSKYSTDSTYIHYQKPDGTWTKAPGEKMKLETTGYYTAGYNSITLDIGTATKLKCCFNNGSNQWDNNGGNDYTIETNALYNTVYIRNGVIQTHPF